jgi:hypothetical protein
MINGVSDYKRLCEEQLAGSRAVARIQGNNKRAPRVDLRRPAVLVDSGGNVRDVTILDVSSGGFRLEVLEDLRIGEFVSIRVERDVSFPAQIRWMVGNEAGGVFLTLVNSADWT